MKKNNSFKEIADVIQAANSVAVVSHVNPDPDAFGSSGALALALRSLGKKVVVVNESGPIDGLSWIPLVLEVRTDFIAKDCDLIICCDCGDAKRVGDSLLPKVQSHPRVVNLDHHASNDFFGHLNFVEPNASSAAEVVLGVIEALPIQLSAEMATALYAGLSADTGSFCYSSTSAAAFVMARKLVEAGASPFSISQELYARTTLASLKLQAEVLQSLRILAQGKISLAVVTFKLLKSTGANKQDADSIVDIVRDIEGVSVAILLKEDAGFWRVSMRSRVAHVDVAEVAGLFGGGGHKAAAGFRWKSAREELEPLLLAELEKRVSAKR
jgi:phosphoesterase RecJ-like protein